MTQPATSSPVSFGTPATSTGVPSPATPPGATPHSVSLDAEEEGQQLQQQQQQQQQQLQQQEIHPGPASHFPENLKGGESSAPASCSGFIRCRGLPFSGEEGSRDPELPTVHPSTNIPPFLTLLKLCSWGGGVERVLP